MMQGDFWNELHDSIPGLLNNICRLSERYSIAVTRLDNRVTWWSQNAVETFNLKSEYSGFAKEKTKIKIHDDDLEMYRKGMRDRMCGIAHGVPLEYRVKLNEEGYTRFTARTMFGNDVTGKPVVLVTMISKHNVSEDIDPITGLHTSVVFTRVVKKYLEESRKAVLLKIGINRFCNINVMYGSEYGDRVLMYVAEKMSEMIKGYGEVYRLSGAKFAIILEDISREEVKEFYKRLSATLMNDICIDERKVPLKIAAGAITLASYMKDPNVVKSRLMYALDSSRNEHHGELVIFDDAIYNNGCDSIDLISVIHNCALKECDGFFMCYQPIVEASTGIIRGMEALVRWKKEPYGIVPPGAFIDWLEEDPCIFDLGNWIIRQAVKDASVILKTRPDFFVNVNVSASQIERSEFRESLLGILDEFEFPYNRLCIELTERCRSLDLEFLKQEIQFFREQGIKVAMDDFGTGNASLSVAMELPVDEVKIDMSFVKDIQKKPFNQAIVSSIVNFANTTNLEVCIEGVENEQVREYLGQYNADWHQGYHYSKPVVIDEILGQI